MGSLDEATLYITAYCAREGLSPAEVAAALRTDVEKTSNGLTCSVGVAPTRFIAKIASDFNKPNGQYIVPPTREAVLEFLRELPCRKVGGIGKVTDRYLTALNVSRVGQLLDHETRLQLRRAFSKKQFAYFLRVGLGIDGGSGEGGDEKGGGGSSSKKKRRRVVGAFGQGSNGTGEAEGDEAAAERSGRKSLSCERTFRAISDLALMTQKVRELGESIAKQHAECGLEPARTLTLKLKTSE